MQFFKLEKKKRKIKIINLENLFQVKYILSLYKITKIHSKQNYYHYITKLKHIIYIFQKTYIIKITPTKKTEKQNTLSDIFYLTKLLYYKIYSVIHVLTAIFHQNITNVKIMIISPIICRRNTRCWNFK